MNKVIYLSILFLTINYFNGLSQNTETPHSGRVIGSFDVGSKEVTTIYDEQTGCVRKTSVHSKNIFQIDENVNLEPKENGQGFKVIKNGLIEEIIANKDCFSSESAQKSLSIQFPDGTVLSPEFDINDEIEAVSFILPQYSKIYAQTDEDAPFLVTNAGKIKCTCTSGSGCKPFVAAGKAGCFLENCSSCEATMKISDNSTSFFLIQKGQLGSSPYYDLTSDSRPVFSIEEWESAQFVSKEEINSPEYKFILNKFIEKGQNSNTEELVALAVIIKGKKLLVNVPFSSLEDGSLYSLGIAVGGKPGGKYSCSGSCSSGGCKLESGGLGQVVYCNGCQSGCTLNF